MSGTDPIPGLRAAAARAAAPGESLAPGDL